MRAEHLSQWLITAMRDNSTDATNWLKFFAIMQSAFQDGTLAKECMWQTVALIQKREGGVWGIGIFEVL